MCFENIKVFVWGAIREIPRLHDNKVRHLRKPRENTSNPQHETLDVNQGSLKSDRKACCS